MTSCNDLFNFQIHNFKAVAIYLLCVSLLLQGLLMQGDQTYTLDYTFPTEADLVLSFLW